MRTLGLVSALALSIVCLGSGVRPNNYRLPQLTYADDHPGEDLPRFRFAFEVTR